MRSIQYNFNIKTAVSLTQLLLQRGLRIFGQDENIYALHSGISVMSITLLQMLEKINENKEVQEKIYKEIGEPKFKSILEAVKEIKEKISEMIQLLPRVEKGDTSAYTEYNNLFRLIRDKAEELFKSELILLKIEELLPRMMRMIPIRNFIRELREFFKIEIEKQFITIDVIQKIISADPGRFQAIWNATPKDEQTYILQNLDIPDDSLFLKKMVELIAASSEARRKGWDKDEIMEFFIYRVSGPYLRKILKIIGVIK